jgi:Tol biopolymer transport system component
VRMLLGVLLSILVLSGAHHVSAQSAPTRPPFATQIAHSDSLQLGGVESPDGRWLLFSSAIRFGPKHLWIMPTSGGAPRRLTDGAYDDRNPVWFPNGRRIAFVSTRVNGVMTADIEPATGRLIGQPKRVSLEDAAGELGVSPDGSRIVYVDQRKRLRVIPSVGGPAITLIDHSAAGWVQLVAPRFSSDGRDVYVASYDVGGAKSVLLRVPVTGGPATTALSGSQIGLTAVPTRDRIVTFTWTDRAILTLKGDTVAVMPAPRPGWPSASFTRDGRRLYGATSVVTTFVRVVPTAGGKPIDVTNGKGNGYPVLWSADSKRLYSRIDDTTITKGQHGLYMTAVDGSARRFLPMAEIDTALVGPRARPLHISADGATWYLASSYSDPPFTLVAYDTTTKATRVVSRTAMSIVSGPKGADGSSPLYYVEQRRGQGPYELRSADGREPARSLHDFSQLGAPWWVDMSHDRLVFLVRVGDSTVVYTSRLMGAEQRLMAVRGGVSALSWSPDGRALAAIVPSTQPGSGTASVLFVRVTEDGRLNGAPRFVPMDNVWDLYWQPDSRNVLVMEQQGSANHMRVLRVPVDEGQPTVSITPNETRTFWDQYPSPDGRFVAIPVEQFGSSTLWSIDVDAAARAWREKKSQSSSRSGSQ